MEVLISNGGHLDISNLDTNETQSHYYVGTPISPLSLFVLDKFPPTHCSVVPAQTCLSGQSVLRSTRNGNTVTLTWGGWSDAPSGVVRYGFEIRDLVYDAETDILSAGDTLLSGPNDVTDIKSSYVTSLTLSAEGPYSVVMVIRDNAGNAQYARSIVVYDDTSELGEDPTKPLAIIGGAVDGSAYWHNSTSRPIGVTGVGHFYTTNLREDNWLAPVANYTPPVPPGYDDADAVSGVSNALGVVKLAYAVVVDAEGGLSDAAVNQPASFLYNTEDLALENVQVSTSVEDGDSVSIWFEARDYRLDIAAYERVLVHVDSSPPVVGNLGLRKEGVVELISLFGLDDLTDLEVVFEARDEHSGLSSIEWMVENEAGELVAEGDVPITTYSRVSNGWHV